MLPAVTRERLTTRPLLGECLPRATPYARRPVDINFGELPRFANTAEGIAHTDRPEEGRS
jgi:hypothetical protein